MLGERTSGATGARAATRHVLVIAQTGASGRLRILQYLPRLEEAGYTFDVIALGRPAPKVHELARIARAAAVADLVFVQRIASVPLALALRATRRPVVYDIDDALHFVRLGQLEATEHPVTISDRIRVRYREVVRGSRYYTSRKRAVAEMIRGAATTIVGNEFLRAELTRDEQRVLRLPTCIPVDPCRQKVHDDHAPVRIGWIGSQGNVSELDTLEPVFASLRERYGERLRLTVVTAEPFRSREIQTDFIPWTLDTEAESVLAFDIGVMPVRDTLHAHGKCSFKAIQCMSFGVPVVVSPVGMNTEVIEDGVNGMLAETVDGWVDALTALIEDPAMRADLGSAGSATVRARFSSAVGFDALLAVIEETR